MSLMRIIRTQLQIRNYNRVQQPSENPSVWKVKWTAAKERIKEHAKTNKLSFMSTRSVFNLSILYGMGKTFYDMNIDVADFAAIGQYFPDAYKKLERNLTEGVKPGAVGPTIKGREGIALAFTLFIFTVIMIPRTLLHLFLFEKLTRFVPAKLLRWSSFGAYLAANFYIFSFLFDYSVTTDTDFRLMMFANGIQTGRQQKMDYDRIIANTWYATEYKEDFDTIWRLNDEQLEQLDLSYGASISQQLEKYNIQL